MDRNAKELYRVDRGGTLPRLLDIARIKATASWHFAPHKHEYEQFLIVLRGRVTVRIAGTKATCGAGTILYYDRGAVHEEWTDSRTPHESIGICFALDRRPGDLPVETRDQHGRVQLLAEWILEEWTAHEPSAVTLRRNLFGALVSEWIRLREVRPHPMVETTRAFMRENLAGRIGLEDLARHAGMSRGHFCRQYRKLTGLRPFDDLRAMRIEEARRLLLTTDLPIKDVPQEVGLTDHYYLTRLFRRYLRTTPGEIRRGRQSALFHRG